jgi:hypothetical protein
MGNLGEKLQKVHSKVNTKLGKQDGPITFKKNTPASQAAFGKPYNSPVVTTLEITAGIGVTFAQAWQEKTGGRIQAGDLILTIPGDLVAAAWLTDSHILYQGFKLDIQSKAPKEIFGGVPVQWVVTARKVG